MKNPARGGVSGLKSGGLLVAAEGQLHSLQFWRYAIESVLEDSAAYTAYFAASKS